MAVLSLRDYKEALAKLEDRMRRTREALDGTRKNPHVSFKAIMKTQFVLGEDMREANRLRALVECLEKEARKTRPPTL